MKKMVTIIMFLVLSLNFKLGTMHSEVVLADTGSGKVFTWGSNNWGQLGNGTNIDSLVPVRVIDPNDASGHLTGVVTIGAFYDNSLAIKIDNGSWGWGWYLNTNIPNQSPDPNDPTGYVTVNTIALGDAHAIGIKPDGSVWGMYDNTYGQLGDGTTTAQYFPVRVIDPNDSTGYLTDVVAVSAGKSHSVALKADGTVWAWGSNMNNELGDGTTITRYTPVQVKDPNDPTGYLTGVVDIVSFYLDNAAIKSDGTIWNWGDYLNNTYPTKIHGFSDVVAISICGTPFGGWHSLAVTSHGTVLAMGYNEYGQLGIGNTIYHINDPVQVEDLNDISGYLTDVVAVSAGQDHSMVLKSDGAVWSWGCNGNGQLGDGTTIHRYRPVKVANLSGVVAVAAGRRHSLALHAYDLENQAPVLSPIGNKTGSEGQLIEFQVMATDPDGHSLTFTGDNLPNGATLIESDNISLFSWTPDYNQAGNYDVTFTVMDDGNPIELDTELITITIGNVNRPPMIDPIGPQSVNEGENLQIAVTGTDPDGDDIALTASALPVGADFTFGVFSWTPDFLQGGTYTVTFTAIDNGTPPQSSEIGVPITVGNVPNPTDLTDDVVDDIVEIDLPKEIENSYLANLKKVTKFIEKGQINAALNQLYVFICKTEEDKANGEIDPAIADDFIFRAEQIIEDLGGDPESRNCG